MIRSGGSDSRPHIVVAPEEWPRGAAQKMAEIIEQTVARSGHAQVALAGGDTPRAAYRELARMPNLPWNRIDVYFGDERAVSPNDLQSNYRMAREALLDVAPIPPDKIHRMHAERADLDAAADDYAVLLPEQLDLIVLGIGDDGHTASLFPGAPALNERQRKVVVVDSPKPPPRRLTVTPPVIAAARTVIMLVSGASKAAAVACALEGSENISECPAQLARKAVWIMDHAAAAKLRSVDPRAGTKS